jgi:hypothetical protein
LKLQVLVKCPIHLPVYICFLPISCLKRKTKFGSTTMTPTTVSSSIPKWMTVAAVVLVATLSVNEVDAFSHSSSFTIRSAKPHTPSFYNVNALNTRSKSYRHTTARTATTSTSQLSMVIDRMSDECIAATQVSHKVGNDMGLRLLRNEALIVGVVNRPERAGRTLAKYNLMYPLVRKSSEKILQQSGFQLQRKVNRDTMTQNQNNLPFSEEVKITLTLASKIADHFESKSINSEHVLLSLMGYNFGNPIDQLNVPAAVSVLKNTEGRNEDENSKFSAYDFCEDLVVDMNEPYDFMRENVVNEEVVVIGGGSSKTNTLEEVGVDMTQMAIEGRLDKVHGRDTEIQMALRTLGRRRKNNPCLIGDPGVGKVSSFCCMFTHEVVKNIYFQLCFSSHSKKIFILY